MGRVDDRWIRRKDRTRTPQYGKGLRWQVVWAERNGGERKKSFASKDAANAHLTWVNHNQLSGTYVSASRGQVLVVDLLGDWLEAQTHLKESTALTTRYDVEGGIRTYWGAWTLADISRSDVQSWVAGMGKAPRTVETIYGRFNAFLKWCVEEKRLTENPAAGVNLAKGKKREHLFLTVPQVDALAAEIGDRYGGMVWVLATTGLRMSEVCELRVKDLDRRRARLTIARAVVFVGGTAVVGPPKSGKVRAVPLTVKAQAILVALAAGKGRDDLLFTTARGLQVRANNFKRRDFDNAVAAVNASAGRDGVRIPEGLWVHDLRHTAASWAVQSGASVKSVQRMLGHATAAMTLDVYAGLFDQDLDDVAARMEAMIEERAAA